MSIVKNQHFVPQCYLRKFGDSNEKINVFDKSKNEIRFNQPINNIASQRYFYDIDFEYISKIIEDNGIQITENINNLNIDKQALEKWFSKEIEPLLIKNINNIESTYNLVNDDKLYKIDVIDNNMKLELSFLLSVQIMRTMEFRETFINQFPNMLLKIIKKLECRKEFKPLLHAQLILDNDINKSIMESLNKHIWYIGVNLTKIPLYTSDNPIVKYPHKFDDVKSYFGLASEGIEIIYPITSRLALIMMERNYHEQYSLFENKFKNLTIDNITRYNLLQVEQSYRTVFSLDKKFEIAKILCNYDESIKDINKIRMNVY